MALTTATCWWVCLLACTFTAATKAERFSGLRADAARLESWLIDTRRQLHRIPELMYQEKETNAYIQRALESMGIPFRNAIAGTGIVADIGSGSPVIALRSDIDGLPVHEASGMSFASERPGRMHACGHDGHMTMLLGAAKLLKEREGQLQGTVRLIFQPAEEGGAGADAMIDEGVLDGVSAVFGMHVWPNIRSGIVTTKPGPIMAGSQAFSVEVLGNGGHAAIPHENRDPIIASAHIMAALQTVVARNASPLEALVISVTRMAAGDSFNVIPDVATFGGTMRTYSKEMLALAKRRVEEIVEHTAVALGCSARVSWVSVRKPYGPTINDAGMAELARSVGTRLFGQDYQELQEPSMAAEDFSFFADRVPSCFAWLGIRNESAGSVHALHSPQFTLDESVLPRGSAMHAGFALAALEHFSAGKSRGDDEL